MLTPSSSPTAHPLHRRRNPLLLLPRRHHERLLRQHARAAQRDHEPDAEDGRTDGGGMESLGRVFRRGVGSLRLRVVILRLKSRAVNGIVERC